MKTDKGRLFGRRKAKLVVTIATMAIATQKAELGRKNKGQKQ